jgi:thymidine kinase
MAKLYFRYGAMGCGKSAHLLIAAHNYEERGQTVMVVKPQIDTRFHPDAVTSRVSVSGELLIRKADVILAPEDSCLSLWGLGKVLPDCILVDEAQFLTPKQVKELAILADADNPRPIICYGLRADFVGNLFPGSATLMALADSIEEIKTICWCGKKATMNARLDEQGEVTFEGDQVKVGTGYIALCRRHWRTRKVRR